jgi:hypothetical protein
METNSLGLGDSQHEAAPRLIDTFQIAAIFLFGTVELKFLHDLAALIRSGVSVFDVTSAVPFELLLFFAFFNYYRLCMGKNSIMRATPIDRGKLGREITLLVFAMLAMLIAFSQIEIDYHQIKP